MKHNQWSSLLSIVLWLAAIIFCCSIPQQSDFFLLLGGLILVVCTYGWLNFSAVKANITLVIGVAVIARCLATISFPNLSDDVFRFIWDGRLWHMGVHPFLMTPTDFLSSYDGLYEDLYGRLNSPDYYSIYPSIPQVIFWISTGTTSSIEGAAHVMQIIHACIDLITIYLMIRLLKEVKLPRYRLLLYILHPLIIIELIANLHHEVLVICFVLGCLLALKKEKIILSGILISAAIASKVLPVLFCPLIFFYLKGNKRWSFFITTLLSTFLLFAPLLLQQDILVHLLDSADLYMRKFEFNASIYYIYRTLGYWFYGYNLIHIIGPVLTLSTLAIIGCISLIPLKKHISFVDLIQLMMMVFLVYLFLSATVHPWYIGTVLALSIFTPYRMPLIWGLLIMLTYANYGSTEYSEQLWIVALEYVVVFALFIFELKKHKGFKLLTWK